MRAREEPKGSGLAYCITVLVERVGETFRVSRPLFQGCDRMAERRDIPIEEIRDVSQCRGPAFQRKPPHHRTRTCRLGCLGQDLVHKRLFTYDAVIELAAVEALRMPLGPACHHERSKTPARYAHARAELPQHPVGW